MNTVEVIQTIVIHQLTNIVLNQSINISIHALRYAGNGLQMIKTGLKEFSK